MKTIHLASTSNIKKQSLSKVFEDWTIETNNCLSGVNEQPFGRKEIRQGALNRLDQLNRWPAISMESGVVHHGSDYIDVTCVLLRTRFGTFEAWSTPVKHDQSVIDRWLKLGPNRFATTIGSLADPDCPTDWYTKYGYPSRVEVMSEAVGEVCRQWRTSQESLPSPVIPATVSDFNNVKFLDIQQPLLNNSRNLTTAVRRLADRLLFDTVLVMDARGFLMCGEFSHEEYPIVMARKPGKLPGEEICVEYKKEYGTDRICISKDSIKPGSRVIVLDDIIATGGTMLAAEQLVNKMGGQVVAFIAPYVIEHNGELLCSNIGPRLRYVCTQIEAINGSTYDLKFHNKLKHQHLLTLAPPSLSSLTVTANKVPVTWGRYRHSSNIWFNPTKIPDQKLYVFLDPSNHREMIDVLHILSILYRKDPKKIIVVIPFLEQSTQDRVEFKDDMESVAEVDTLGKLIGQHTTLTFDLHAEQSRFAFHDLRFDSLVKKLWIDYHLENPNAIPVFPDDGAAKRFGQLPGISNSVVFRKRREGNQRIVKTDDTIQQGAQYVIIDDLVRSGGTMKTVAQFLKQNGASSVGAIFAHAPLEPKACSNMAVFDEIWTSDSCPRLVPPEWVRIHIMDML